MTQPFAPSMQARARVAAIRARLERGSVDAAVVGIGTSGRAAADLLQARGCAVELLDDRPVETLDARTSAWLGGRPLRPIQAETLSRAELVVLSPGVPRARPEFAPSIADGRLVGEVELATWFVSVPLLGITGTNGKSTTTALIAHILGQDGRRVFAGGNLGEPLSRLALAPDEFELAVVELSSYQLESIVEGQFRVACWLNLASDHTDRYPSVDVYAAAKRRLLERRSVEGWAVVNAHDPYCAQAGLELGGSTRWFSTSPTSNLAGTAGSRLATDATCIRVGDLGDEHYDLSFSALTGLHNKANAIAAIECARVVGASPAQVQTALSTFTGLPHRLELVGCRQGVSFYNDSKATNIDSALRAVKAVNGPVHLIAGGRDKGSSWAPLVERAGAEIKVVYAVGEAAELIERAFSGSAAVVVRAEQLDRAVELAAQAAQPGEVVLLSPACASFDQFKNFEERGASFRASVEALDGVS